MRSWLKRAADALMRLSQDVPHRLNEVQPCDLALPEARCVEHLCALANLPGGGYLVFGVDESGADLLNPAADPRMLGDVVRHIAQTQTEPPVFTDYAIEEHAAGWRLFVHVYESAVKPIVPTGQALDRTFIRADGTTRRASRQEVGALLLNSRTPRWEELHASVLWSNTQILSELDASGIARLLRRETPSDEQATLRLLEEQGLVARDTVQAGYVTQLGAIAAAHRLGAFPNISRKAVRVIVYDGVTRQDARIEQEGRMGYAIAFEGLMEFVTGQLPQSEVIDKAFRQNMPIYPEVALREIIANALIHQDFAITGAGPMVEIFSDRIEVTNPGGLLPSKRADRLFSTSSESRNERLARAFRLYGICEERGSGLFRAGRAVELYGLPPVSFDAGINHFKVTLYAPKTYAQMSVGERLQACYQHAVIQYVAGEYMTNKSLRERLRMPEARRSMVSLLIQQGQDAGLIRPADPDNRSKKFMQYLPIWA